MIMGRVRNISMGLAKKGLAVIPEKVSLFMKHKLKMLLELSCCKKRQKSPNQETSLGNRGYRKVLNDTKWGRP